MFLYSQPEVILGMNPWSYQLFHVGPVWLLIVMVDTMIPIIFKGKKLTFLRMNRIWPENKIQVEYKILCYSLKQDALDSLVAFDKWDIKFCRRIWWHPSQTGSPHIYGFQRLSVTQSIWGVPQREDLDQVCHKQITPTPPVQKLKGVGPSRVLTQISTNSSKLTLFALLFWCTEAPYHLTIFCAFLSLQWISPPKQIFFFFVWNAFPHDAHLLSCFPFSCSLKVSFYCSPLFVGQRNEISSNYSCCTIFFQPRHFDVSICNHPRYNWSLKKIAPTVSIC